MTELEVLSLISLKMFYAVVCGSAVGIERKLNDSSAGFKTQILVCVGSMLFTVVPTIIYGKIDDNAMRVIAQIVSGVGFLGAGAILHSSTHQVVGLTTAAWIWFTAAIGVIIGIGHGPVAIFTTMTLVTVITIARKVERRLFNTNTLAMEENHSHDQHKKIHHEENNLKKMAS
ncbi:MAG: MgtC/SapB family protein [Bdellovibrio sp.]